MPSRPDSPTPGNGSGNGAAKAGRKSRAADATHHEALWYARHVDQATPLVIRLRDGEEIRGVLEWYDRAAYRIGLESGGHLVVQKSAVQTLRKA